MPARRGKDPGAEAAAAAVEPVEQLPAGTEETEPAGEIDLDMPGAFYSMGEAPTVLAEQLILPVYGADIGAMPPSPPARARRKRQ